MKKRAELISFRETSVHVTSLLFVFFVSRVRNRILYLSSSDERAHQTEYSDAENHLEWIFPLNFYGRVGERRRNSGIILSLAREAAAAF